MSQQPLINPDTKDDNTLDQPVNVNDLQTINDHLYQEGSSLNKRIFNILNQLVPYFKNVRGSWSYLKGLQNQYLAMLQSRSQLPAGPSWFLTVSPADCYWPENFHAINSHLTEAEVQNLSHLERQRYLVEYSYQMATMFHEHWKAFE